MCVSSCGCVEALLSASDAVVSQEVADGEISVQSAYALSTIYMKAKCPNYGMKYLNFVKQLLITCLTCNILACTPQNLTAAVI
jgi:hypothetical protein